MSGAETRDHAWSEQVAAYVLDALSPEERESFERHLAGCARCPAEVDEMREVAAALALAAPPVPPPAALRERVLEGARRARRITSPVTLVSTVGSARTTGAPTRAGAPVAWFAVAASVVILLVGGWGYRRTMLDRDRLARDYASARTALAERDRLLAALLTPDVRTIELRTTDREPSARVYWNPQRRLVVLTATRLPPAPAGRTYQLWGIPADRAPVSLGTFEASRAGRALVTARVPEGVDLAVSAVTEEPAGGSPQPTSAPFLVGQWAVDPAPAR